VDSPLGSRKQIRIYAVEACGVPTSKEMYRTQPSSGKVIATIFWDAERLLLIDYSPPKKTITGQYYAEITCKLHDAIKQKRHGKLSLGVRLLHKSLVARNLFVTVDLFN